MIPGSEHAPVIALDLRTGRQRMATEQEIEALRDTAILLRWDAYGPTVAVRRLSCEDPADQREIWRLAALALGTRDEEAINAVLRKDPNSWSLVLPLGFSYNPTERILWRSNLPTWWMNREEASAALCAHISGPL